MDMEIHFYTKEDCPLCKRAEELLYSFTGKYTLTIHRIDIKKNQEAYQKYWDMIPVIELPDGTISWGVIDREEIESGLNSASSKA